MEVPQVTFNFAGKRALVTGAGRGIGRGIAIALAQAGAETYALSKTQQNLDLLIKECPSIRPMCVDLTDWSATRRAVEALPPIDLLVNNAGIGLVDSFVDIRQEDVDQILAVNLKSVLNVSQVVAKSLISRGSPGSIVNMSSLLGVRVIPNAGAYCSSKGALDQLTRTMTLELGPHKIRVNSVNPTVVKTDMGKYFDDPAVGDPVMAKTPLGRFAEVSDIVGPVLFLLSDAASMVSGNIFMIDGGYTVS